MITLLVPPGIGDFSAMYSKLCGIKREIEIVPANDGPPRLMPFLEILPKVKPGARYGNFSSGLSLAYTLPPGTDLNTIPEGKESFMSINAWLESGNSVDSWIPGPTDYHYEMNISPALKAAANDFLRELPIDSGVLIGVYCTSYSNSRHWGFWGPSEWFVFLDKVRSLIPDHLNPIFIFIGAEYDGGIAEVLTKMMIETNVELERARFKSVYTLGRFHIGTTIEIIKKLNYFFVFPSGLGFLADVVNTPHVMWFPPNLDKMRYTFTDPSNGASGQTVHNLFSDPIEAAYDFMNNGYHRMEENYARSAR